MKKLFFLSIIIIGFFTRVTASDYNSNLIVFAEDGQKFYLFLNGVRQNMVADKLIKVTAIPLFYVNIRVVFEDTMIKPLYKKSVSVQDDRGQDLEVRYNIYTSPEKTRSLVFAISMPKQVAPKPTPDMMVVPFNNKIMPPIITLPKTGQISGSVNRAATQEVASTNANTGILRPSDAEKNKLPNSTTTRTTTTSTSTTSVDNATPVVVTSTDNATSKNYLQGYNGRIGCEGFPMNEVDFQSAVSIVTKQSFDDTKLITAKQVANYNCLTTDQVKQLLKLFSFESNKLSFAKYVFDHTIDIANYFKINDVFSFSSSVQDLNDYIIAKK